MSWFASLSPVWQGLLATTGTWLLTALGAFPVLFIRSAPRRLMDAMLGFAAGVMVAASCWSLLIPSLELAGPLPAVVGLLLGAAFLYMLDQALPHLHALYPAEARREGPDVPWRRIVLLMLAITLHNLPEGLAVGVAYGGRDVASATALAIGIGFQNMPEGLAVALSLRREGWGRIRALWYGQLSAIVQPLAGVTGAYLVLAAGPLFPYVLSFAAGAMLYVVVEELIPETERSGHIDIATLGFIVGFAVMMALDNLVR